MEAEQPPKVYSERFHLKLFQKCVRKYYQYDDRCSRVERYQRISRDKNRLHWRIQGELFEPMSVEELNAFMDLKPKLDKVIRLDVAYSNMTQVHFYPDDFLQPIGEAWHVIKKRCRSFWNRIWNFRRDQIGENQSK
uniref:DDE_Tnp_ISL3 domain-containing protein n=1 Tax=Caenorhabditis tropicalis TaxID=1561998 RepID=A0A1I7TGY6_9PELO